MTTTDTSPLHSAGTSVACNEEGLAEAYEHISRGHFVYVRTAYKVFVLNHVDALAYQAKGINILRLAKDGHGFRMQTSLKRSVYVFKGGLQYGRNTDAG